MDKRNTYVRMLLIYYSFAFNTIVPFKDPGTEHLSLQLDPGLPDGLPPGGEGRQKHIRHVDPQHGGSSGVSARLQHYH